MPEESRCDFRGLRTRSWAISSALKAIAGHIGALTQSLFSLPIGMFRIMVRF